MLLPCLRRCRCRLRGGRGHAPLSGHAPAAPALRHAPACRRPAALPACDHEWHPVPGWRAGYHCAACGAFGRKQQAFPAAVDDDYRPLPARPGITPYRCTAKHGRARCVACAVGKVQGEWVCPKHAGPRKGRAARAALARSAWTEGAGTRVLPTLADVRAPDDPGSFGGGG